MDSNIKGPRGQMSKTTGWSCRADLKNNYSKDLCIPG